jgi:hypothetical protein
MKATRIMVKTGEKLEIYIHGKFTLNLAGPLTVSLVKTKKGGA